MLEMNFGTADLLKLLEKNRHAHAKAYEKMQADYKKAFEEKLRDKMDELQAGKIPSRHIDLQKPFHYLDNYDDVIEMLQNTTDEHIKLTNDQYKCYARDKWPNKAVFESVSGSLNTYLSSKADHPRYR